jgi:hypothetical protein
VQLDESRADLLIEFINTLRIKLGVIMSTWKSFLVLSIVSFTTSSANAGLFCGAPLRCDLSVNPYSKRIEKQEQVKFYHSEEASPYQSVSDTSRYLWFAQTHSSSGDGYKIDNCSVNVTGIVPYVGTDPDYIQRHANFAEIEVTCTKTTYAEKNQEEYSDALCRKAIACANRITNTDELKDYIQLKDSVCSGRASASQNSR